MLQDINVRVTPEVAGNKEQLLKAVRAAADFGKSRINDWKIVRRSIDARQRQIYINLTVRVATAADKVVAPISATISYGDVSASPHKVLIVGAGPAGLFAALRAIERGLRPVIFERGKDVDSRRKDLAMISRQGLVDEQSNYCFGEGGAGAYSDGKLYTRSKKRGNVAHILQILHQHGADPNILIEAHPHIGTDKLPGVIKNIRTTILNSGGEVHFSSRVESLVVEEGRVQGLITADGVRHDGPVVLATGHSARDVYRMLPRVGVKIEAKGLAVGVRLEHPQHLIDQIQYHSKEGRGKWLPAAEYSFVDQVEGRGVYSFCMCPGGVVVPAASAPEELVVNGMSSSARCGKWANSGMVVEVRPGDIDGYARYGEFEMLQLQEDLEHDFFKAAGRSLKAPAQRMADFVAGKISTTLPASSYAPGLQSLPLHFLLPPFIAKRLQEGFRKFGRKSRGFLTNDATLIGLESRTSSPVRIPRDSASLQHIEIASLYPAGEGAGYAGGIVSAAIDGERCIDALASTIFNND